MASDYSHEVLSNLVANLLRCVGNSNNFPDIWRGNLLKFYNSYANFLRYVWNSTTAFSILSVEICSKFENSFANSRQNIQPLLCVNQRPRGYQFVKKLNAKISCFNPFMSGLFIWMSALLTCRTLLSALLLPGPLAAPRWRHFCE